MLFNSYPFLFLFLPITALVFFCLATRSRLVAASWLGAASLFFYGYWNAAYVGLLLLSIIFNYAAGFVLAKENSRRGNRRKNLILGVAVSADLALLGYYKYANFFLATANHLFSTGWPLQDIMLPLGISFFTFTQIAFLVDVWAGKAREYNFIHYLLFVTYFPHLIAGPVLHHKEMMPQFALPETYQPSWDNITIGLTIFSIGLFKKVVLADGASPYANAAFAAANTTHGMDFFAAWGGVLAYSGQLYFDFSGYSDMAIGVSRLFGIILPLNFNSPYKAGNITDFWRCWHMTLSRFLRDYLYIPLGGNRHGLFRQRANLMLTMLLGGLWHGAAWTFVLWGALHGVYLVINHAWRALRERLPGSAAPGRLERLAGWGLTFFAVVVAWVFFRATTLAAALNMLHGMLGMQGFRLPAGLLPLLGGAAESMRGWGVEFSLGGGSQFVLTWSWALALLSVALFLPNTQQLMCQYRPGLDFDPATGQRALEWKPDATWACLMALIAAAGLLSLSQATEFLYYQF